MLLLLARVKLRYSCWIACTRLTDANGLSRVSCLLSMLLAHMAALCWAINLCIASDILVGTVIGGCDVDDSGCCCSHT